MIKFDSPLNKMSFRKICKASPAFITGPKRQLDTFAGLGSEAYKSSRSTTHQRLIYLLGLSLPLSSNKRGERAHTISQSHKPVLS